MDTHLFTEAGLGKAPFTFLGEVDTGKVTTCCDYCGTPIRYEELIRSADGITSKVGCECIFKHGDAGLRNSVKLAKAERERMKRAEKARIKEEKRMADRQLELQKQRDKNGGLTDDELRAKEFSEFMDRRSAFAKEQNQFILAVLEPMSGDFINSMKSQLEKELCSRLSYRQQNCLADIYAIRAGRRNSKAYNESETEFWSFAENQNSFETAGLN